MEMLLFTWEWWWRQGSSMKPHGDSTLIRGGYRISGEKKGGGDVLSHFMQLGGPPKGRGKERGWGWGMEGPEPQPPPLNPPTTTPYSLVHMDSII